MNYWNTKSILILIILVSTFSINSSYASTRNIVIQGNEYSDEEVITSLIDTIPDIDDKSKSNYILKKLNDSGLFKNVEVSFDKDNFYITLLEYPSINKVYYSKNERIKDDEIDNIIEQLEINTLSKKNINTLIEELTNIYKYFGYNNIEIITNIENINKNSANLFIEFIEGDITKIKKINLIGNKNFDNNTLLSKIKSKTKNITNIFANNNFKLYQIENDVIKINNFYKSQGFRDIVTDFNVEYFPNNKVIVNFNLKEGERYFFSVPKLVYNLKNESLQKELESYFKDEIDLNNKNYNKSTLTDIEIKISEIIEKFGEQFFQINLYEKITEKKVDTLFEINEVREKYINQINISGNTRTFDYVIRREIDISEGDPINKTKIKQIKKQLNQLTIFDEVNVKNIPIDDENENLEIEVSEKQTGSFNVGLSVGTLDGASFLSGLKERNINGTGRSLEFLINTSDDNRAFTLSTTDKFILNPNVNHQYSTKYKENDYTKSKSYKLNIFNLDTTFKYLFSPNLYHTFGVGYSLKDYIITNSSTVSSEIEKSAGENVSFHFSNEITYNTLNSYIKPTKGNYFSFENLLESPSSSNNGSIKNVFIGKKYLEFNNNIFSAQFRAGNILSLSNNEILSDDKFSLGGRWLRGFDNFGAGPRNSRTSYIGGNNIIVTKFDFSKPLTLNDQNPIYLNLFNDYGYVWQNKNTVTFSDNLIRASYGFGLNYYSPIGPIGFSWGFPLSDKDYDIKRMFLFTIGNLN